MPAHKLTNEPRRTHLTAFTTVELLVILGLAAGLFALFLPNLQHSRDIARSSRRDGVAATLHRVEAAKATCVSDRRLRAGSPLDMHDLLKGDYLSTRAFQADGKSKISGATYIVGAAGSPVTFVPEETSENKIIHNGDHHAHQ